MQLNLNVMLVNRDHLFNNKFKLLNENINLKNNIETLIGSALRCYLLTY